MGSHWWYGNGILGKGILNGRMGGSWRGFEERWRKWRWIWGEGGVSGMQVCWNLDHWMVRVGSWGREREREEWRVCCSLWSSSSGGCEWGVRVGAQSKLRGRGSTGLKDRVWCTRGIAELLA